MINIKSIICSMILITLLSIPTVVFGGVQFDIKEWDFRDEYNEEVENILEHNSVLKEDWSNSQNYDDGNWARLPKISPGRYSYFYDTDSTELVIVASNNLAANSLNKLDLIPELEPFVVVENTEDGTYDRIVPEPFFTRTKFTLKLEDYSDAESSFSGIKVKLLWCDTSFNMVYKPIVKSKDEINEHRDGFRKICKLFDSKLIGSSNSRNPDFNIENIHQEGNRGAESGIIDSIYHENVDNHLFVDFYTKWDLSHEVVIREVVFDLEGSDIASPHVEVPHLVIFKNQTVETKPKVLGMVATAYDWTVDEEYLSIDSSNSESIQVTAKDECVNTKLNISVTTNLGTYESYGSVSILEASVQPVNVFKGREQDSPITFAMQSASTIDLRKITIAPVSRNIGVCEVSVRFDDESNLWFYTAKGNEAGRTRVDFNITYESSEGLTTTTLKTVYVKVVIPEGGSGVSFIPWYAVHLGDKVDFNESFFGISSPGSVSLNEVEYTQGGIQRHLSDGKTETEIVFNETGVGTLKYKVKVDDATYEMSFSIYVEDLVVSSSSTGASLDSRVYQFEIEYIRPEGARFGISIDGTYRPQLKLYTLKNGEKEVLSNDGIEDYSLEFEPESSKIIVTISPKGGYRADTEILHLYLEITTFQTAGEYKIKTIPLDLILLDSSTIM